MAKNKVIQVRFSEENVIGITAKTRLLGLGNSSWIRMIVLRELEDVIVKSHQSVTGHPEKVLDIILVDDEENEPDWKKNARERLGKKNRTATQ